MIEVSHLSKKYGTHPAIEDLSFTVGDGQIFGLLGPNGAGKSTIMNILTGYLAPTSGEVKVAGFSLPEQAQQAVDLAVWHRKREILHGRAAAVGLAQVRNFDHSKLSFYSEAVLRKAAWTQRFPVWNCYSLDGKCV